MRTTLVALATLLSAGCTLVSGVDSFHFASTGGANASSTASGSGTSTGATTGATTGTGCGPAMKTCNGKCVSLADPMFGCSATACSPCAAGSTCCGSFCVDTTSDPNRCGNCNMQCGGGEWCSGSNCTCRPGLVLNGGACVDPKSNPMDCGGNVCNGQVCQNGMCVASCTAPYTACSNACVNELTDPLHCGSCTTACATDEVCANGHCVQYGAAAGCTSCPCAACNGDVSRCCSYPGTTKPICVSGDASACP